MNLIRFVLGQYQSNCYILYENYEAMIIDPGYPDKQIIDFLEEHGIVLKKIYITHGHFDHTGGVNMLKKRYPGAIVYAPRKDMYWYMKDPKNGIYEDVIIDEFVSEDDYIIFQEVPFKVIETPGHSYGSTCLYYNKVLFSGDTLFYHSVGRTDLYLGDQQALLNSINNKLYLLPDDTVVYPGHGNQTTIMEEKINNPFTRREFR